MVFEVTLNRTATAKLWRSEGPETSIGAKRLQELFDQGKSAQYELEKSAMEKGGQALYRKTDGKVFQLFDQDETMEVPVKFQVKLGTINWYFLAPKDETHQSFRDELYIAAAIGHLLNVPNHCEKYWRGTNSFHLKKMHTKEEEDSFNHNHYRLEDNLDASPLHVTNHLIGLVEAQHEMDLYAEGGEEKFLTLDEASKLAQDFNVHWVKVNHIGPEKDVVVGNEAVHLPETKVSLLEQYKASRENTLTPEDIKEWAENKQKEEPCRVMSITREMPLAEKIQKIAAGTRGIGSELAETRQLEWSKRPTVLTVVSKDDKLPGKQPIPEEKTA